MPVYRIADVAKMIEHEQHLNGQDANQVCSFFTVPSNPQLVDYRRFCTLVNQEKAKYDEILLKYDSDLVALSRGLQSYHSGVHKWFIKYVNTNKNGMCLEQEEFSKALRDLNCNSVTEQSVYQIFYLLDRKSTRLVRIADIEGLFKTHQRKSNPFVSPDDVIEKILRAFNVDFQFIQNELKTLQY